MKLRNLKKILLFICIGLFLTSCFDIKETIKLNSDGTGTYSFVLDMGQLKELFMASRTMAKNMTSDSLKREGFKVNTPSPVDQMKPKFDELKSTLNTLKGISNYTTVYDSVNFKIGAQFDFANKEALNLAINTIQKKKNELNPDYSIVHINYTDKSFERLNTISPEDINTFNGKDSISNSMSAKVRYSILFQFDKKIKSYSNMDYFMSGDRNSVIFTANLQDLINGKGTIANEIKF